MISGDVLRTLVQMEQHIAAPMPWRAKWSIPVGVCGSGVQSRSKVRSMGGKPRPEGVESEQLTEWYTDCVGVSLWRMRRWWPALHIVDCTK